MAPIELGNVNNALILQLLQNPANGGDISLFAASGNNTVGIGQDVANSGAIKLSGANGNQTVLIGSATAAANSGAITLFGPNGQAIMTLSSVMGLPNNGFIGVQDATGAHQARMTFDQNTGNSIILADLKPFVVPHPTQPDTDIMYVCIEGPEAAAFVRGTAQVINGEANIDLPDHFVHIANLDTMTVHVTPLSADSQGLAVVGKGPTGFVVRELQSGRGNYDFDWEVKCVRRGHEDFRVIRPHSEMAPLGGLSALGASPPLSRPPRAGSRVIG